MNKLAILFFILGFTFVIPANSKAFDQSMISLNQQEREIAQLIVEEGRSTQKRLLENLKAEKTNLREMKVLNANRSQIKAKQDWIAQIEKNLDAMPQNVRKQLIEAGIHPQTAAKISLRFCKR